MPYALKPEDGKVPAWRAIKDASDAEAGEVVVQEPPAPGEVWDASENALRPRTEAEQLEEAKAQKVDSFAAKAVDELRPYVTGEHGDREMLYLAAKHIKALFDAQGLETDPRLDALISTGDKAMQKKEAIGQASTSEDLEAIEWEQPEQEGV